MLNSFDQRLAEKFEAACPNVRLKKASENYLEEPRGKFHGTSVFVASPASTEDVAAVIQFAAAEEFGIVPYGGGTGLVGGQVAQSSAAPLLLSLERMSSIRNVYPEERALIADAGCTIEKLQQTAAQNGLLFPLSYASKGTATIGAGLSVNSGGLNVLRYGMARNLCLGIEAVLPNGSIYNGLRRLRKDNTGYDLRNLLIGSEGTLGIITGAAVSLAPLPSNTSVAFISLTSPQAALTLLAMLQDRAGEVVSAYELLAGNGLTFLAETHPSTRQPFTEPPDWSVLVEVGTGTSTDAAATLEEWFVEGFERGLITDGLVASSEKQKDEFWAVRETLPEANRTIGAVASHDISLPLSEIPDFIDEADAAIHELSPEIRINAFGHLGDGNLHYNAFPPTGASASEFRHLSADITQRVLDLVAARDGSFSAEHGIGRLKREDLVRYGDPTKLEAMRTIKAALDPKGIMNPGAVFAD